MTRAVIAPGSAIRHGASSRLPGGGPVAHRVLPAPWWSGASVARPLDDVRSYAAGTTVTLRGGPVVGDDRALAVVEVGGHPAGVLRERPARGRLGARRTLVLAGRVHTLRHGGPGPVVVSVRDGSGRVVAEAARFACPAPGRPVVDWRLTVADRDLWLRVHPGCEPRRRTLLDDRGRAWLSRPRRGGREAGVHGATTVLPSELGSWDAAAAAWLLAEIEQDATDVRSNA